MQLAVSDVKKIKFWIKAFIPRTVYTNTGANCTESIKSGNYMGKTYVTHPIWDVGYLTDQRSFSTNYHAPARRTISGTYHYYPNEKFESFDSTSDPTIAIDKSTGKTDCNEVAESTRHDIQEIRSKRTNEVSVLKLYGESGNSCDFFAKHLGKIDLNGRIVILKKKGLIGFSGMIDQMPAFEMYVQVNGNKNLQK